MGAIRDKMKADLELRRYAETTKREYLRRAQNFVAHYRRPPTDLGQSEIRKFLLHLVQEKKVGAATHHMYVAYYVISANGSLTVTDSPPGLPNSNITNAGNYSRPPSGPPVVRLPKGP
jgi:hypothetical protein